MKSTGIKISKPLLPFAASVIVLILVVAGYLNLVFSVSNAELDLLSVRADIESLSIKKAGRLPSQVSTGDKAKLGEMSSIFVEGKNVIPVIELFEKMQNELPTKPKISSFVLDEKGKRLSIHVTAVGSYVEQLRLLEMLSNLPYVSSVKNVGLAYAGQPDNPSSKSKFSGYTSNWAGEFDVEITSVIGPKK